MPAARDHDPSGRVPYWVHQIVEVLLGILLLVQGARTGEHTVALVSLGCLLVLLALCSEGPLTAWPWIGRRVHRWLDGVAAAALAVSPVLLSFDHVLAIVLVELAAAAMLWLAVRTDWRPRARRRSSRRSAPPASEIPAPPPAPARAPDAPLARRVGQAVGRARDDGPYQLGRLYRRARDSSRPPDGPPDGSQTGPEPPTTP